MKIKYVSIFLITLYSCTSQSESTKFDFIEDETAKESMQRAIDQAGGISNWSNLKELNFEKTSILFLKNGSVEDSTHQKIAFSFNPFKASLSWSKKGDEMNILFRNDSTLFFQNDSLIDINNEKRKSSVMSALYTVGMPFKLLDEGTRLSYEGSRTLNGSEVEVIQTVYDSDNNANHSSSEVWWYYFNNTSGDFVGSMVYHPPTYALIENESFEDLGELKFPGHRLSYRVDSLGNKQFLRGEFFYKSFKISY